MINNLMTLNVLKIVKIMVSYGFYKSRDEFKELSMYLMALLNGTTDVYNLKGGETTEGDMTERNGHKLFKKQIISENDSRFK
jgi:hypothetical protein